MIKGFFLLITHLNFPSLFANSQFSHIFLTQSTHIISQILLCKFTKSHHIFHSSNLSSLHSFSVLSLSFSTSSFFFIGSRYSERSSSIVLFWLLNILNFFHQFLILVSTFLSISAKSSLIYLAHFSCRITKMSDKFFLQFLLNFVIQLVISENTHVSCFTA